MLMTSQLHNVSASNLAAGIAAGDYSPVKVVDAYLDRISQRNDQTNAYVTILEDRAREQAQKVITAMDSGEELGPLAGVPVAIKDLAPMTDVRTTFGSKLFADNVADTDAILVERLEAAGAIPIGKTNACEFGHKGTTDNPLFGPTSTPFDLNRNAGGSSGGSAAAVADALAPVAHGGDGGGSIRIPAACCGVYGLNPSFGRIPQKARPDAFNEHTPFVRRGPLTRTVKDAALLLDALSGTDPRDLFALPDPAGTFLPATDRPVDDISVAYSPDLGLFPLADSVREVLDDAIGALAAAGADIVQIDPSFDHSLREIFEAWKTTWRTTYAGLAEGFRVKGTDFIKNRNQLSPAFFEIIEEGLALTVPELKRANRVRTSVADAIRAVHANHDLLVTSTLSRPPVKNEQETIGPDFVEGQFVGSPIGWCLTYPFNLIPNPSASVPAGLDDQGLPVGMQFVGGRFADDTVLAASAALERERPWKGIYGKI
jgi:amidase/aspartyl-tRNA(Asn)/glutamyl-tRNA(Gln) amidotransferase subunit A